MGVEDPDWLFTMAIGGILNPQDSDSSLSAKRQTTYEGFGAWFVKTATLLLLVILIAWGIPRASAHAGIFSFVADILLSAKKTGNEPEIVPNSQTMPLLRAAQNIDPNPSQGGGDITIVDGSALLSENGPSGTLADIADYPASDQISVYVVRPGDSLAEIAEMFGVSVNTIVWANDITQSSRISVGQTLVILPVTGVRYRVAPGDTLQSIAKKFKGDLGEILAYNNLSLESSLQVGDVVLVPDGEISTPPPPRARQSGAPGAESIDGYYLRPIVGGRKTQGIHGYNGVDLASYEGAPIYAAAAGEVIVSRSGGWNGGYGNYVVIRHSNGTQTLYAHNASNNVVAGERVSRGHIIGFVGSSGKSTGPHVHFEVRGAKNPF